jgi:hypothetical protein
MGWNWDDLTIGSGGAPAVATPCQLASHVFEAEGTQHVFYRTFDDRIVELWWRGGDAPRWGYLTNGDAPAAASDPASHVFEAEGTQHVFYRTVDMRIVELWWAGGEAAQWGYLSDLDAPQAASDPASHVFPPDGTQHVFYRSTGNEIIELVWSGAAAAKLNNLTQQSGAPRADGDPASHVFHADGTQHVFYRAAAEGDTDSEIIELWWRPGQQAQPARLSQRSGAPRAAGDPVSHVFAEQGTQHVFYLDVEGGLTELRWFGLNPPERNLVTAAGGAQPPASKPASHVFPVKSMQHVFYIGDDLEIRRFGFRGELKPALQDLMLATEQPRPPLAVGTPTSHVFNTEGTQHVFYTTGDDHVIELWSWD